jgi:hypothetical protein
VTTNDVGRAASTLDKDLDRRASEAWDARFRHIRAANNWVAIAAEEKSPERRKLYETLASWMTAYADADARHEKLFTQLAIDTRATGG